MIGGTGASGTYYLEGCDVACVMDVYNDACYAWQWYAYRYAGMIIGSVRHNTTNDDEKTVPNMTGISTRNNSKLYSNIWRLGKLYILPVCFYRR